MASPVGDEGILAAVCRRHRLHLVVQTGRIFRIELLVPATVFDNGLVLGDEDGPADVSLVVPNGHVPLKLF